MAQIQVQSPVSAPNGVPVPPATTGTGGNTFTLTSLYVGDLDPNVNDTHLYDLFNQIGTVMSVRVCRDLATSRSLGYGYVNYSNSQDASRALELLNFTPLLNKSIRIMYSHRDPSMRKSGAANIFVKNLDKGIDHKALHDTFSVFGNILSCKIATDELGQSKGYGFVQFDNEGSAQNAIDKLNGMLLNEKQVYVGHFLRKQDREAVSAKSEKFNNVYVKNLSESASDDELKKTFGEYGTITSAVVMRDADGKSKCFGFVNFENADAAAKAVEALNGKKFDNNEWYVGRAQKKSERDFELKGRFEQSKKEAANTYQGLNLYIKNLDDTINDDKLKELFTEFGTITSCKVMRDSNGTSRGSGFVAFSTSEEASRAITEMNGKIVANKPLYVSLAQRKEDRRARLQAQFSQMRPIHMAPPVISRMAMYPPGVPCLGQHLLYGQAPPSVIPPQAGFGHQQQLVPGIGPGGVPVPNFYVPMVQPGQQGQRPGGPRGAGPLEHYNRAVGQRIISRGHFHRHGGGVRVSPSAAAGAMPVAHDTGAYAITPGATVGPSLKALVSALANSTPVEQRTLLGESLFPLVACLEPDSASKVTGMLLGMDKNEVLHLIESPDALQAKVAEAMEVLRNVAQQPINSPTEELASLTLNDNLVS